MSKEGDEEDPRTANDGEGGGADDDEDDAGKTGQSLAFRKGDIAAEIQSLIARAKSKIQGVTKDMDTNAERLKTLQKGLKDLKRQQTHIGREQQQSIGTMQSGLR